MLRVPSESTIIVSKIVLWHFYTIHHWHHHALHATHQDTSELQIPCLSNVWSWNGIHRNASNHQGSSQVWRPSSEQPQGDAGCKYICVCLRMCLKCLLLLRNLLGCLHLSSLKVIQEANTYAFDNENTSRLPWVHRMPIPILVWSSSVGDWILRQNACRLLRRRLSNNTQWSGVRTKTAGPALLFCSFSFWQI